MELSIISTCEISGYHGTATIHSYSDGKISVTQMDSLNSLHRVHLDKNQIEILKTVLFMAQGAE